MENPQYPVNLVKEQWNLVLSNVVGTGFIHKKVECDYLQTYRKAGSPPPTEHGEGLKMFVEDNFEKFGADSPIDIYIYPAKDAVVRIDR